MVDEFAYTLADVEAAEAKIRAEWPQGSVARQSYGWGLAVHDPGLKKLLIVYEPGREDREVPRVALGADEALERLQEGV